MKELEWKDFLPIQPFIERRFTSLGLHFLRVAHEDIKHTGSLPHGYIICISTGPPCILKHKTEYGEQTAHIQKGDINVTPPCQELSWEIIGRGEFTCVYASKFYIDQVIASLGMAFSEPVIIQKEFKCRDRLIEGVFEAIDEQFETNDYRDHVYVEAMARTIFIHLLHKNLKTAIKLCNGYQRTFSYEQMARIHACILERLEERIPSADLARCVHVSDYHFYRIFRRTTGMTPQQFIKNVRLERARYLLEHTQLNLYEIAYKTGFSDHSHFSREFRALFGMTPRTLRIRIEYDRNLSMVV